MTEQEKREKVISDLEEQIAWIRDNDFHKFPGWGHAVLAMRDALALLKAQEPRVMTLQEVRDEAEYMYLEKHSDTGSDLYGCAIRGDWDGYGIELLISEYDCAKGMWRDYGKTWRCWTSRPTDEQRNNTPWEV